MSKKKLDPSRRIGPPPRKQYRNLKPTLADPDDPIYKLGFLVGGRRLTRSKPDPDK
jgi:hypothetical protein